MHRNLAEDPCSMTYFLKLFSKQLQMGSRLIFDRLDRRVWLLPSFEAGQIALLCPLELNMKL